MVKLKIIVPAKVQQKDSLDVLKIETIIQTHLFNSLSNSYHEFWLYLTSVGQFQSLIGTKFVGIWVFGVF